MRFYKTLGLSFGHTSQKKIFLTGKEQKTWHKMLSPYFSSVGIYEYEYEKQNKEEVFSEVYFGLGKSYRLRNCDTKCHFRIESGLELSTLEHGSNISLFAEMQKNLPISPLIFLHNIKFKK